MHQDPEIGVVSRKELEEGLRVNRYLEEQAEMDIRDLNKRIEIMQVRIREREEIIESWREAARTAPERLERIRATMARQETQLAAMATVAPKPRTEPRLIMTSREARIVALTTRIAAGDMTAISELTALAKG